MAKNKKNVKTKFKPYKGKKGLKGRHIKSIKEKLKSDDDAQLIVRNLSFKTTEETLRRHFDAYGRIRKITLLKKPNGDPRDFGYVLFETVEEAKRALEARKEQPFLGRPLQIGIVAEQKSNRKKKEEIKSEMVTDIKSEVDDPPKENIARNFKPNKEPRPERKFSKPEPNEKEKFLRKARLIVRNVSFKATEESLKKHFEPHGEVLESVLLKKANGDLIGCGFIQFKNVQMATKAILETNAKPFLGRPIHVDWAVAKNKYMAHVVQQQDELEHLKNDVKEEPLSDDENEVKFDTSDVSIKKESDDDSKDDDDEDDDKDSEDQSDDDDDEEEEELDVKKESSKPQNKVSANDAEDGRTIFLKNVSFSVTSEDLEQFAKQFGEINYALVCMDKLTEHSKGSAFIRFKTKEDADIFLSAGPERMMLQGQAVQSMPALFRDKITRNNVKSKQPKDARNLYLIKEGVILANSKAANGVSQSDMAKRLSLEQNKSLMLKNLNRFISPYRLTIHNIPLHYSDEDLRKLCLDMANVKPFCIKECRIMKHLKGPLDASGKHASKGYGFITFTKHEDALSFLRRVNNNPSVFDKNNRPIVSFSIEDKAVINARNKRLEKSKIKNPLHPLYQPEADDEEAEKSNPVDFRNKKNFKNKPETNSKDAKKFKKGQKNTKPRAVNENKMEVDEEYMGETGKSGKPVMMRNRFKLRMQANMHRENVKQEKRKQKLSKQKNIGRKERIKQPKQKQNLGERKKLKRAAERVNDKNFTDLVNKYKSKLVGDSGAVKLRKKWYADNK